MVFKKTSAVILGVLLSFPVFADTPFNRSVTRPVGTISSSYLSAAGSTTQIQYNNNGAFGADSGLTYTGGLVNIVSSAIIGATSTGVSDTTRKLLVKQTGSCSESSLGNAPFAIESIGGDQTLICNNTNGSTYLNFGNSDLRITSGGTTAARMRSLAVGYGFLEVASAATFYKPSTYNLVVAGGFLVSTTASGPNPVISIPSNTTFVGVGITSPTTQLEVSGTISATQINVGQTGTCSISGTIRYNLVSNTIQFCNGAKFVSLVSGT